MDDERTVFHVFDKFVFLFHNVFRTLISKRWLIKRKNESKRNQFFFQNWHLLHEKSNFPGYY